MPTRLRVEHIEQKPKEIEYLTTPVDSGNLLNDPAIEKAFNHLLTCIMNGTALPSGYYRKGAGLDSDALLASDGIMHLHLGKSNTPELVYLVQYPDHVVILELSDHSHFADRPAGRRLRSTYAAALSAKQAARAAAKAAKPKIKLPPRRLK